MKKISILLAGIFLLASVLACGALTDLQGQAGEVRETAQAAITQVEGSELMETLQAAATEIDESGALQTARAVVTEKGPMIIETARAVATEKGSMIIETARAAVTQEGPALENTAQALGTRAASSLGELPEDIPLVEGDNKDLFTSRSLVSYTTAASFQSVVDFYTAQMPLNGWTAKTDGSKSGDQSVVLRFTKGDRTAIITISDVPLSDRTLVVIAIT